MRNITDPQQKLDIAIQLAESQIWKRYLSSRPDAEPLYDDLCIYSGTKLTQTYTCLRPDPVVSAEDLGDLLWPTLATARSTSSKRTTCWRF